MPIEAEIKARVHNAEHVHAVLAAWAPPQVATYSDAYFDRNGELTAGDRELRVRQVRVGGTTTSLLTYKGPAVDAQTGSKTELETTVEDAEVLKAILATLGYTVFVAFDKHCSNYRFDRHGRAVLATVVQVPQIDGTFIEVETLVADADELEPALEAVRCVLRDLDIGPADETRDTYTDAVIAARHGTP